MKKREIIRAGKALSIWKQFMADNQCANKDVIPLDRYVRRYCERYEGILCYKSSTNTWLIYKDLWEQYIMWGFPDMEIRQPVMTLSAGLRYLHQNGIPTSYKLREFKKDLESKFPQWINRRATKARITRGHLNKFLGVWNGNR